MGWVVNTTPRPLYPPEKKTWYRRLGGPQGRSGRVRKTSLPTGIRSPECPARSESLYRLRYAGPSDTVTRNIFHRTILTIIGREILLLRPSRWKTSRSTRSMWTVHRYRHCEWFQFHSKSSPLFLFRSFWSSLTEDYPEILKCAVRKLLPLSNHQTVWTLVFAINHGKN